MKGLDLSKFKKIGSDKDSTTLQHPEGHTIRIAHAHISPKMREEFSKLPVHKAKGGKVQRFEDGGDSSSAQDSPEQIAADAAAQAQPQQQPPVNISINAQPQMPTPQPSVPPPQPVPMPTPTPQPSAPTPGPTPSPQPNAPIPLPNGGMQGQQLEDYIKQHPGPQATTGFNPNAPTPQPPQTPAQQQESADNEEEAQTAQEAAPTKPTPAQTFADIKTNVKNDLSKEDLAWQQDLANGHITPLTYHDLFARKDTLGKIGTVFGMLIAGAGAGLTHQPNALMQIMNNEINNDLEAQKQSKANAQNFLRLNQQHQLQTAQIKQMNAETQAKTFALSQAQMLQSSYHHLVQQVNKMPEGPQKEAAKTQLGFVYKGVADKINNINDQAAGAAAYYNTLFGGQQGGAGSSSEQQFQKQTSAMRMMGPEGEKRAKDLEDKHFPGLPGQASVPLSGEDRTAINSGIDFDQKLHRFIDWTKNHSGDLNPADKYQGQALAAELQGAYRQATHGGVYKEGEQNFISKLIDSEPTKFFNSIRVLPQLKAIAGENQARVNQLVKSKGFPGYQGPQTGAEPQYKTVNGVRYMRGPNGEAIRVK